MLEGRPSDTVGAWPTPCRRRRSRSPRTWCGGCSAASTRTWQGCRADRGAWGRVPVAVDRRAVPAGDARVLAAWDAALAVPPWDGPPVWLHGDPHPANILVRDGRVSGVI